MVRPAMPVHVWTLALLALHFTLPLSSLPLVAPHAVVVSPLLPLLPHLAAPALEAPADHDTTVMPAPRFSWLPSQGCPPVAIVGAAGCRGYRVQIQQGSSAAHVLEAEVATVITRFVPARGLPVGEHRWRVGVLAGSAQAPPLWSEWRTVSIVLPSTTIEVAAEASYAEIQEAIAAASNKSGSLLVRFDPGMGARTLDPGPAAGDDPKASFATLTNCSDVILDFSGASLSLARWVGFFAITDCARVTVRNLTLDVVPLPYTSLRVEHVSENGKWLVGSVLPGHPSPIADPHLINTRPLAEVQNPVTAETKRGVAEVLLYYPNVTAVADIMGPAGAMDLTGSADASPAAATGGTYKVWLQPSAVGGHNGKASVGLRVGDIFTMGQRVATSGFSVT